MTWSLGVWAVFEKSLSGMTDCGRSLRLSLRRFRCIVESDPALNSLSVCCGFTELDRVKFATGERPCTFGGGASYRYGCPLME